MLSYQQYSFKDIGAVVKLPAVWIIAIVTFCNYVFTLSLYYFVPYATSLLGMTVASAALLAAVKRYISPISNVGGGYIGDKIGTGNLLFVSFVVMAAGTAGISAALLAAVKRYISPISNVGGGYIGDKIGTGNLLFVSFVVMAAGTAGILLLPLKTSTVIIWMFVALYIINYLFYQVNYSLTWAMMEEGAIPDKYSGTAAGLISTVIIWMFVALYIINYLFYQVNYSLTWAMMEEGAIPDKYSGTAAGLISTIGYLPDIFISLMAGKLLDSYPGVTGYRYFFIFLIAMLILGAVFVTIWKSYLKKNKCEK